MKNLKKILILSILLISVISCSPDETLDNDTAQNFITDKCISDVGSCCGTSGRFKVIPGKRYTYTASTNLSNPVITWEVDNGAIELITTQGSTATFMFNSNFTTGTIRSKVVSTNSELLCDSTLEISKI